MALAAPVQQATAEPAQPGTGVGVLGVVVPGNGEVFPLLCPKCGGQMRLIAFITESIQIRKILDHIGADSEPPHIPPTRGPPLWDDCSDAQTDEGVHIEPDWATDWDGAAQPASDVEIEVDQRISW